MVGIKRIIKMSRLLLKKGHKLLSERCTTPITAFPPSDHVLETIDECKDELRELTGFWKGKGMSIASTQIGRPQVPLFVMCSRENWFTEKQYRKFQSFLNPEII